MKLYGKTVSEVLPLMELYTDFADHERLTVFVNKGRECVRCGIEGRLLIETIGSDGDVHIDLYTDEFIMMTVDHIYPRGKARREGWLRSDIESLDNKQPMCWDCNALKADKAEVQCLPARRPRKSYSQINVGTLIMFANNNNIFNKEIHKWINHEQLTTKN